MIILKFNNLKYSINIFKVKNSKLLLLIIFLNSAAFVLAQDINKINIKYASYVVNESGALLGYYGEQNRVELKSLDLVPQHCINCLISTEDRDFWSHDGVSVRALTRAAYETIFKGRTQGGSTLTMQLARNLFLSFEKTLQRKVKEIKIALDLEKRYSKKEILLLYLNFVYFGNGAHGLWAASEEYFSKEPKYLSIDESAVIVSLLKSPEQYNPYKFPDKALNRRNEVMYNMVENGKLDK
ncbi:MAG: penicillin-binding protein, partial [Bacteroidota bacterium]|nr:penicillin-binding protein [Bacteroidota bacterium]